MKVIIAKIVVVVFIVVLMALDDPLVLSALLSFAGIVVVFLALIWAIDTIADDRNQKRKGVNNDTTI